MNELNWNEVKGKEAQDKITGFTGIITAKAEYLYGCTQFCLKPRIDKEGKLQDGQWFDEGRIKIVNKGVDAKEVQIKEKGCDFSDMPKNV